MPRFAVPSVENLLVGSLFFLILGVFGGNVCIAIGQGLFFVVVLSVILRKEGQGIFRRSLRASSWFLIAMTVAAMLSILANLETIEGPFDYVKKLRYPIMAIGLLLLVPPRNRALFSPKRINLYLAAWLGSLAISVIIGLGAYLFAGDTDRLSGLYGQVMTFAYTLQFSVIALVVLSVRPNWIESQLTIPKTVLFPCLALAMMALYLTYTRGAMLGAMTGIGLFCLLRVKWLVLPLVLCVLVVGLFSWKQGSRYLRVTPLHRITHWEGAALTFAKYPLLGVGYRNYEQRSAELKKEFGMPPDKRFRKQRNAADGYLARHAHNNYLEAFASMGILGGLPFLGFCFCWMREAWRSRYASLFVPLIAAFLVSGLFENTFFDSEVLNCILLIYLFSQIVFDAEVAVDREDQLSAGTTTTET